MNSYIRATCFILICFSGTFVKAEDFMITVKHHEYDGGRQYSIEEKDCFIEVETYGKETVNYFSLDVFRKCDSKTISQQSIILDKILKKVIQSEPSPLRFHGVGFHSYDDFVFDITARKTLEYDIDWNSIQFNLDEVDRKFIELVISEKIYEPFVTTFKKNGLIFKEFMEPEPRTKLRAIDECEKLSLDVVRKFKDRRILVPCLSGALVFVFVTNTIDK